MITRHTTDVLVLGAGLAAARAVVALRKANPALRVVVATRDEPGEGGSSAHNLVGTVAIQAPGFSSRDPDDAGVLALEIAAGGGDVDHRLANVLARGAAAALRELIGHDKLELVTRYDDTALLTQSQFSDQTRTYHLPLDQLRKALRAAFRNDPQVDVRPHTRAITLLRNAAGRCIGALLLSRDGRIIEMLARVTLLATGGAAGLFAHSLAHPDLLGDGWTLAADAGAQLANLEFVSYVLAGRRSGHQLEVVPVERFRRDSLHPLITDAAGNDIIEAALPDLVDRAKAFRRRSEMPAFTIGSIAQRIDLAILQANRRHDDPARPGVPSVKVSLDGGPLYTEVAHHAWSTAGGVVVNRHGFTGVPGLFAAGEVTTGMLGAQPPGGTDAAVALVFGALAGAAMAAEVAGVHHDGGRIDDVPVYDGLQVFDDPAAPMADREVVKAMRLFAASTLPIKPHEALRGQFVLRRDAWRATLPSLGEALANPDGESRWAALDIHFAFATLQRMVRATLARTTSLGPVLMDDALDTDGITLTAEQVFDNTERQVVTIDDDEAAKWSGGDDDGAGSSGE